MGYSEIVALLPSFRNDDGPGFSWAADVDHDVELWASKCGSYSARVGYSDIAVLVYWFRDSRGEVPDDCQTADPMNGDLIFSAVETEYLDFDLLCGGSPP